MGGTKRTRRRTPLMALLLSITLFFSFVLSTIGDELNSTCEDCNSMCENLSVSRVEAATMALKTIHQEKFDHLESKLSSEREKLAASEAICMDLQHQLAEAAAVEPALRKELAEQQSNLQKEAENSMRYKTMSEELETEITSLRKTHDDYKKESSDAIDMYKAKLMEARNKQNDLQRELMDAKELVRELELRAIPMRVNMTLILEDVYDFTDTIREHSASFGAWLQGYFHGMVEQFFLPTISLLKQKYYEGIVPLTKVVMENVQVWYDANLNPRLEQALPVLNSLRQSAIDWVIKLRAGASGELKLCCRKALDYLDRNVDVTKESDARKRVVSGLKYTEANSDLAVRTAGQGILVFALVILILKLTRRRNRMMIEQDLNAENGIAYAAGVGRAGEQ